MQTFFGLVMIVICLFCFWIYGCGVAAGIDHVQQEAQKRHFGTYVLGTNNQPNFIWRKF